jgi:DNA-binding MarR family transcriptional regulator
MNKITVPKSSTLFILKFRKTSMRLKQSEYVALAQFRYEIRHFLNFSEEAARKAGVEPRQHQALLAVRGFGKRNRITIGELAEKLQIRHHSAVGLVDRLVVSGLAKRIRSSEDRRHVFVELTRQGSQLLENLVSSHRKELRRLGPQLNRLLLRLNKP